MIPEDLRYTAEHEWVAGDGSGPVRVGITHFAQDALGDIVFVQLPEEGTRCRPATRSARSSRPRACRRSTRRSPARWWPATTTLADEPELINTDPYAAGWLVEIAARRPGGGRRRC